MVAQPGGDDVTSTVTSRTCHACCCSCSSRFCLSGLSYHVLVSSISSSLLVFLSAINPTLSNTPNPPKARQAESKLSGYATCMSQPACLVAEFLLHTALVGEEERSTPLPCCPGPEAFDAANTRSRVGGRHRGVVVQHPRHEHLASR